MSSYTDVEFTWDEGKRHSNLRKHGYDFADACRVFNGYTFTAEDTREAYGEWRLQTLGLLQDAVVVITHTERSGTVRLISMRKATKDETQNYFSTLAD